LSNWGAFAIAVLASSLGTLCLRDAACGPIGASCIAPLKVTFGNPAGIARCVSRRKRV